MLVGCCISDGVPAAAVEGAVAAVVLEERGSVSGHAGFVLVWGGRPAAIEALNCDAS